jgi:hypothetical protein
MNSALTQNNMDFIKIGTRYSSDVFVVNIDGITWVVEKTENCGLIEGFYPRGSNLVQHKPFVKTINVMPPITKNETRFHGLVTPAKFPKCVKRYERIILKDGAIFYVDILDFQNKRSALL